ncbi:54S ribosomal protein L6 mitochondrial [Cystobasidiomycetes sp. EMM_F5]
MSVLLSAPRSRLALCARQLRQFASSTAVQSHVGSAPIRLPEGVDCVVDPTSTSVRISGPRGHQVVQLASGINARLSASGSPQTAEGLLVVTCADPLDKAQRSQWGLRRALVANAVTGVSTGFQLPVKLVGVGYRATVESTPANPPKSQHSNKTLVLRLGYPQPIRLSIPDAIECSVSSPTDILLSGADRNALGSLAAVIRNLRVPEPYNGKGVFVGNEQVKRKEVRKK